MKWKAVIAFLAVLIVVPVSVQAYIAPESAISKNLYNDFANIFFPEQDKVLAKKLDDFKAQTGNEFSVVVVNSLDGLTVEEYALRVFNGWGIEKKSQDNGILLLVANDDRKVRIEVGYGLEPVVTDAFSNQVIQKLIIPAFKKGDFYGGVEAGITAVIEQVQTGNSSANDTPPIHNLSGLEKFLTFFKDNLISTWFAGMVIFVVLVRKNIRWLQGLIVGILGGLTMAAISGSFWLGFAVLVVFSIFFYFTRNVRSRAGSSRDDDSWGSGPRSSSGSGSSSSFGGGRSGGGGASGSW